MEDTVGPGLLETLNGSVHSLSGGGEGTTGQRFDSLGVSDFGTSVDDLLLSLPELLGEVSEL